jgi:hypothetical protein
MVGDRAMSASCRALPGLRVVTSKYGCLRRFITRSARLSFSASVLICRGESSLRIVAIVGLLLFTGCAATQVPRTSVPEKRGAQVCKGHPALSQCQWMSVAEYQAWLRSLTRPSAATGVVH